ncbi:hypothetical protein GCM10011386_34890 [Parapedobacter defluvii]|uniref:Rhodanese domain-containing protein n=3 Tax=Parapedobacter defluvii TaxID=2045106 RepID=A0ABQ1MMN1_9SPHI|nr:hypothetical protein GCM10011386_34890 [Parapedobacter defluvii]
MVLLNRWEGIRIFVKTKDDMRYFILLFAAMLMLCSEMRAQQQQEPWNSNQLMEPENLANRINKNQTANLLILTIGPDALIKGSVDMGPAQEAENIDKMKGYLKKVPKDKEVVIYCGCCPFDRCPNVRPAFNLLKEMGFKNAKLLNLRKNIKVDWLDKDYPINE